MPIKPFQLERYFALYEFKLKYLLSPSDCEALSMAELLEMGSPDSMELWQGLKLAYTESQGHPLLRAEVARLYQQITPENVVIAAPEEAIFIAMQTLLRPGDEVMAISPAYQSLHEIARAIGCEVVNWALEAGSDGNWHLDLGKLEDSLSVRTRLIVINFPHNPTGYMLALGELDTLIGLARKRGITIFSDEMYRLLEYEPAARLPAVCDLYEKGISLSGLSKSFALPGLRMGWLATQESEFMERWLAYKDYTTICNSAPGEILAIIALQNKERILRRNLDIIQSNLESAEHFFSEHTDRFSWFHPLAGSVAFPEWLGKGPVEQFCQDILENQGVMIVPGSLFGFPGNHFRIGLGRWNFPETLEHVDEYLKEC
ncbi:MAG: aminotransferase class I/II-fold pyridoxal phosphate-dependent enzyme [Anaerolineales bacterium]